MHGLHVVLTKSITDMAGVNNNIICTVIARVHVRTLLILASYD